MEVEVSCTCRVAQSKFLDAREVERPYTNLLRLFALLCWFFPRVGDGDSTIIYNPELLGNGMFFLVVVAI